MIAIIDYGAGNLRSIKRAFESIGSPATVTTDPASIAAADAVVFPGVGHAGTAMRRLHELGLPDSIRQAVAAGKPFLGVCLGLQLLFGHQDEGDAEGLGILPGRVRALSGPIKVPHIGWNQSRLVHSSPLGPAGSATYYYFVHSYMVEPAIPEDIAAEASYGGSFPSIVIHDNIWGTQFHPEKSGPAGLALLRAFTAQPLERRTKETYLSATVPPHSRHSDAAGEESPREAHGRAADEGAWQPRASVVGNVVRRCGAAASPGDSFLRSSGQARSPQNDGDVSCTRTPRVHQTTSDDRSGKPA